MKRDDQSLAIDRAAGPLSVGLISPGWPSSAFANGIIPYVANTSHELRGFGHTVTVVAQNSKGGVDGVDVRESNPFYRPRKLVDRTVDALCYRVVAGLGQRRVIVRALVEECRALIEEPRPPTRRDRGVSRLVPMAPGGPAGPGGRPAPRPVVRQRAAPWGGR